MVTSTKLSCIRHITRDVHPLCNPPRQHARAFNFFKVQIGSFFARTLFIFAADDLEESRLRHPVHAPVLMMRVLHIRYVLLADLRPLDLCVAPLLPAAAVVGFRAIRLVLRPFIDSSVPFSV